LYCAGESLCGVYDGTKKTRFYGSREGDWEPSDYNRKYYEWDDHDYFPFDGFSREGDGRLVCELKEFVED
jgi:hypothetical protein